MHAFFLQRNNATGHYSLDLSVPAQREICQRLLEIRADQIQRLHQLNTYYAARSGQRDDIERIWRNCKMDGELMIVGAAWKAPHEGIIEFDFVVIQKPMAEQEMGLLMFEEFLQDIKR